jgi:hypothetical protein
MKRKSSLMFAAAVVFSLFVALSSASAAPSNFSFTGNFTNDNDVQLFTFTADAASSVVLQTWSYAGGTNAAGDSIARGGFDPILAVFDSTGLKIGQNDDGGSPARAIDLSGQAWDTYLDLGTIGAGTYTVAVMQYDNFAVGPNLSNGFVRDGQGNFTAAFTGHTTGQFWDVSNSAYSQRDSHWAFDILGVEQATQTAVPEPFTMLFLGSALIGAAGLGRKFKK